VLTAAHFITNSHDYVEIPINNEQDYQIGEQRGINKWKILPKPEVDL
jgi:hypothetical protein